MQSAHFYKQKGPCLKTPLNWTGSVFPLLTKVCPNTRQALPTSALKSALWLGGTPKAITELCCVSDGWEPFCDLLGISGPKGPKVCCKGPRRSQAEVGMWKWGVGSGAEEGLGKGWGWGGGREVLGEEFETWPSKKHQNPSETKSDQRTSAVKQRCRERKGPPEIINRNFVSETGRFRVQLPYDSYGYNRAPS